MMRERQELAPMMGASQSQTQRSEAGYESCSLLLTLIVKNQKWSRSLGSFESQGCLQKKLEKLPSNAAFMSCVCSVFVFLRTKFNIHL